MTRLRIDLSYDGSEFSGWARQPGLRTVQGEVEAALAQVLRLPSVDLTCAGRTDAGVHARGQVCHADLPEVDLAQLARRIRSMLPDDIAVGAIAVVEPGFDARFSALWRRYAYRICDSPGGLDPLRRREVLAWRRALDHDAMNTAAAPLLGEHDFAAFCRRRPGATTVRTMLELHCSRNDDGLVECTVIADAFCHQMVRSLVGALVAVGEGRHEVAAPSGALRAGVRDSRFTVLPAHGLTLEEVAYPSPDQLTRRAEQARTVRILPGAGM
ncbi:MAG: tRNA pseudouridine(38-40) synthase TruA [Nocardioidaceae bacterium]